MVAPVTAASEVWKPASTAMMAVSEPMLTLTRVLPSKSAVRTRSGRSRHSRRVEPLVPPLSTRPETRASPSAVSAVSAAEKNADAASEGKLDPDLAVGDLWARPRRGLRGRPHSNRSVRKGPPQADRAARGPPSYFFHS
ncbi:MAG: hypothetical protein NVS4B10_07880 [Myxococcales bacterium]